MMIRYQNPDILGIIFPIIFLQEICGVCVSPSGTWRDVNDEVERAINLLWNPPPQL